MHLPDSHRVSLRILPILSRIFPIGPLPLSCPFHFCSKHLQGTFREGRGLGGLAHKGANQVKKAPFGEISALSRWPRGAEELVLIGPGKALIKPRSAPISDLSCQVLQSLTADFFQYSGPKL